MVQRDSDCFFAKTTTCGATLYSLCPPGCKFKCTAAEYRERRQRSFDRRRELGCPETAADIGDLRTGIIRRKKEEQSYDLQEC